MLGAGGCGLLSAASLYRRIFIASIQERTERALTGCRNALLLSGGEAEKVFSLLTFCLTESEMFISTLEIG